MRENADGSILENARSMELADRSIVQVVLAEDDPAGQKLIRVALEDIPQHRALPAVRGREQTILRVETEGDFLLLDFHLPVRSYKDLAKLRPGRSTQHAALRYFFQPLGLAKFTQLGTIARGILSERCRPEHGTEPRECGGIA